MVKSMTGYGKSDFSSKNVSVSIEIKAVNSRFFDFSPKVPRSLVSYEEELYKIVKNKCIRGKISLIYRIDFNHSNAGLLEIDEDKLEQYVGLGDKIRNLIGSSDYLSVDQVIRNSDLFKQSIDTELELELKSTFFKAANLALESLDSIRNKEGDNLRVDLKDRVLLIESLIVQIEDLYKNQKENDFDKYLNKISNLLSNVKIDENRLLQEVAILADKRDISEEIVRLRSHIKLYNDFLDEKEVSVGKKINFLLQELGREINTVGSKIDNVDISHIVVSIKDELEKIREQVQNIL